MENGHANDRRRFWVGLTLILAIYLALGGIRYFAPDDLGKRDQERPTSYIIDIVQNDNWICPRDAGGGISSKPPMHPWIAAVASHALGGVVRPAWLFPSLLSMLVATGAIYMVGRRRMGWEAALLATTIFLLSHIGAKMMGIVRTDPLFGCVVLLNALAALWVWERGSGWTPFWIIALVNTMIKGPLGVILAFCGLLAVWWERRTGHPRSLPGSILPGMVFWASASLGWLLASWWVLGDEVIAEVIGRELMRHAVLGDAGEPAITRIYQAPFYLLTRFFPWSFFTIAAVVRVIRRPSTDDARRRFDRFLVCWILAGLAIFALVGHQRPSLIFPLIPPSALLAGSVLADLRWLRGTRRPFAAACILAVVVLPILGWVYGVRYPRDPEIRIGLGAKQLARQLQQEVGPEFPIAYASAPMALQVYLGVWRRQATDEEALKLLASPNPAFVAVRDTDSFIEACEQSGIKAHAVHRWDDEEWGQSFGIVGNRERLAWFDPMTGWVAPFAITFRGVRPAGGKSHYLDKGGIQTNGGVFLVGRGGGGLNVVNLSDRPAVLRLDLRQGDRAWREEHLVRGDGELILAWPRSGV
jgi:4-amino-4-deoxy-L-arabinose transferase-like glycosyltransferase